VLVTVWVFIFIGDSF